MVGNDNDPHVPIDMVKRKKDFNNKNGITLGFVDRN